MISDPKYVLTDILAEVQLPGAALSGAGSASRVLGSVLLQNLGDKALRVLALDPLTQQLLARVGAVLGALRTGLAPQ